MQLSKQKHSSSDKLKALALIAVTAISLANPLTIYAESITFSVDGNGGGSTNEIKVESNQQQTVSQNNSSDQQTDVNVDANTGGNNVSDNTGGDVNVETGDVHSEVTVVTKDTNINKVAQEACCQQGSSVTISNNGSDSQNTVNITNNNSSTITQNNQANINNTIKVNANTGNNVVKNNTGGDTKVTTGNIYSEIAIANKNINNNHQKISGGSSVAPVVVIIKNNGSGSSNEVIFTLSNDTNVYTNNLAYINNNVLHEANTGNNIVDGNTGGIVWLKTGSVGIITSIINKDINTNFVDLDLCCQTDDGDDGDDNGNGGDDDDDDDKDDDKDNGNGKKDDNKNGGGGDNNGSSGGVGGPRGQVLGTILPATGANSITWLLASSGLITAGIGLKLREFWLKLQGITAIKVTIYY